MKYPFKIYCTHWSENRNNLKLFIHLLVILAFVVSCNRKHEKITFSKFEQEYNVLAANGNIKENFIHGILYAYDSLYIMTNTPNNNHQIHVYNRTFEHITSSGITGRGPGEITNPFLATLDNDNGIIWFFDMGRKELLKYPVDSILLNPGFLPTKSVPIPEDIPVIIRYKPQGVELFSFANIASNDILISFFNHEGEIIDSNQIVRSEKLRNLDNLNQDAHILATYIYDKHPQKDLYVIAYRFSDIITVVDSKGGVVAINQGPDLIDQIPDVLNDDQKLTYADLRTDENYIYALYLGDLRINKNQQPNLPTSIHIFDWNANPIARLNLDHPIPGFTKCDNLNRLISFSLISGDIVYYDLPPELINN